MVKNRGKEWLKTLVIFFGLLFALGGFSIYQTCSSGGGTFIQCSWGAVFAILGIVLIVYILSKE